MDGLRTLLHRHSPVIALVSGVCLLALLVLSPGSLRRPPSPDVDDWSPLDSLRCASALLRGQRNQADVATDIIGLRALAAGRDPYPVLGPALAEAGIDWDVNHASTHPPGAYLLTAPVAWLPIRSALAAWAWLMLLGIGGTWFLLGARPMTAAGLAPLTLLWPPAAFSLGQQTVPWLLAAVLALRTRGAARGGVIALAAGAKLLPALLLIPLIQSRSWRALAAFGATALALTLASVAMNPRVLQRYWEVNRSNSVEIVNRNDNAALLVGVRQVGGRKGVAIATATVFLAWAAQWRRRGRRGVPSYTYLSVALLPIAWIYSSVVFLPVYWDLLRRRRRRAWIPALASFGILFVPPYFGWKSAGPIAVSTLLLGGAMILDGWRSRPDLSDPAARPGPARQDGPER